MCFFLDIFFWTHCVGSLWETFKNTFGYTWIYTWVCFNMYVCDCVLSMYFEIVFFVNSIAGDVNINMSRKFSSECLWSSNELYVLLLDLVYLVFLKTSLRETSLENVHGCHVHTQTCSCFVWTFLGQFCNARLPLLPYILFSSANNILIALQ